MLIEQYIFLLSIIKIYRQIFNLDDDIIFETKKKLICIFWWSQNRESTNPKKVHINSWFEDIHIKKQNFCGVSGIYKGLTELKAKLDKKMTTLPDSPQNTYKKLSFSIVLRMKKIISKKSLAIS